MAQTKVHLVQYINKANKTDLHLVSFISGPTLFTISLLIPIFHIYFTLEIENLNVHYQYFSNSIYSTGSSIDSQESVVSNISLKITVIPFIPYTLNGLCPTPVITLGTQTWLPPTTPDRSS